MKGSRSAARAGGRSAFRTAIKAAIASAPQWLSTETPDRSPAATHRETAVRNHESRRCSGLNFGRSGCQATASP